MDAASMVERAAWRLGPGVRRVEAGRVAIGGSPTTIMRLTAEGAAVLDRALRPTASPTHAHPSPTPTANGAAQALLSRLERRGMLVATPAALSTTDTKGLFERITVVVPVRNDADGLASLLASLVACAPAAHRTRDRPVGDGGSAVPMRTVVVDDASTDPQRLAAVAARFGAELIRRDRSGGPGAARTTGLAGVRTPWAALLDADTTVTPDWLVSAGAHLVEGGSTDAVALVAPRVAAHNAPERRPDSAWRSRNVVSAYEQRNSPLDLGVDGGSIAPGTRLAYAPSAAWLIRVEALARVGGFDPDLRYGEDVDLIWRLVEAGWTARYEPRSLVTHRVRPTPFAWVEQRFRYGTSAAPLAVRHPGALAPVVVSPWSAGAWGLVALGHPIAGVAVAAGSTAALARRLEVADPAAEALRLAGRGTVLAGSQLARGLIRPWWPLTLLAACRWRRGSALAAAGLAASALHGRSAVAIADDVAYGAGVWWGVVTEVRRRPNAAFAAFGAVLPGFGGGQARRGDELVKRLRSTLGRGERAVGNRGIENDDNDMTDTDRSPSGRPTEDGAQRLGLKKQRRPDQPTAHPPAGKRNDGGGSW